MEQQQLFSRAPSEDSLPLLGLSFAAPPNHLITKGLMRDLGGTQWICGHPDLDSNTVSVTFKCVTFVQSLIHSDSQFSQVGNGVKNIQAEEFGGR